MSSDKMKEKFTAAIIGCGNIGVTLDDFKPGFNSTHFSAYNSNKKIDLVAVCDPRNSVKKRFQNGIKYYSDIDLLLEEKIDIYSVATPDDTHFEIIEKILDSKHANDIKAIWCEKPIATSLQQARDIIAGCKKMNIKLLVNFIRRYDPFYKEVKEKLPNLVGEISEITCLYSGGIVTTGSHIFDILDFLVGKCKSINSSEKTGHTDFKVSLTYNNAISVSLIPISIPKISILEIFIIGSKGKLKIMNKPFGYYDYKYYDLDVDDRIGRYYFSNKSKNVLKKDHRRTFFDDALRDLIDSIENNSETISNGETALNSLEVISAITLSSQNDGNAITLPINDYTIIIPKQEGDIIKWKN